MEGIMRRNTLVALVLLALVSTGCIVPEAEAAPPVNVILAQGTFTDAPGGFGTNGPPQSVDTSEVVNLGLEWTVTPGSTTGSANTCLGSPTLVTNMGLPGDFGHAFFMDVTPDPNFPYGGMAFSEGKAVPPMVQVRVFAQTTSPTVSCTVDWVVYGSKAL
jgi:hypothetical protein